MHLAARFLPLLVGACFVLSSCGGSNGSSAVSGVFDLANSGTQLAVTFPAGDVRPGAPALIAAGDFNGDGKTDLLLGASFSSGPNGSRPGAGEAYVLYGPLSGDIDLSQKQPDVRILGAVSGDSLGAGVAAGDLNGDGIDDIVVGAPLSNGLPEVRTQMGVAYVVFGGPHIASTVDTATGQQDFDLQPAEGFSHLGQTFAVADVNGDGIADLIAGAPYAGREPNTPPGGVRTTVGEVYVVYGSHDLHGHVTVAQDDEDVRLSGVNQLEQFGSSVAAADVSGDGIADIIVGASGYDGPAGDRTDPGGVFVFFGGKDMPKQATLRDAAVTITGADANDNFGTLVAAADVNNDNRAEVIGSAPGGAGPDNKRSASGEVSIIDIAAASSTTIDLAKAGAGVRVFGPTANEFAPSSVTATALGGTPRIAFGSDLEGPSDRPAAGTTHLINGKTTADIDLAQAGTDIVSILGASGGEGLGGSVAFADIDGDGIPELLVLAAGNASQTDPDPNYEARLYAISLRQWPTLPPMMWASPQEGQSLRVPPPRTESGTQKGGSFIHEIVQ